MCRRRRGRGVGVGVLFERWNLRDGYDRGKMMGKACWIALVYRMQGSQAYPTPQGHSGEYKGDLMAPKMLDTAPVALETA